jgi:hypothetical protein
MHATDDILDTPAPPTLTFRFYGKRRDLIPWRAVLAGELLREGSALGVHSGRFFFNVGLSSNDVVRINRLWRGYGPDGDRWNSRLVFDVV